MTVVPFRPAPPPPELVYVCNCGCRTHYHHADGRVECSACGTFSNVTSGGWAETAPPAGQEPAAGQVSEERTIVDLGNPAIAIARVAKRATPDLTAALICVQQDGRVAVWASDDMEGDRGDWMRRRLDDAMDLMKKPA